MESIEKVQETPEFIAGALSMDFSVQVYRKSREQKLTLQALAKKCGICYATVREILDGKPNITLLQMAKVAVALGVKLSPPQLWDFKEIK